MAKKKKFKIVTVTYALLEAERNIKEKLDNFYLSCHYQNILEIKPKIQPIEFVSIEEITKLEKILPLKDIPILLGAILSNSQILITLDRKHFLDNNKLKEIKFPFEIINPGEFLRKHILK